MNDRLTPENAFGLRWIQDDEQGRLIGAGAGGEYRTPADAIRSMGLGCEEAELKAGLDRFPPHLRIHGGYTPGAGEPLIRFTLTWEPGAADAAYSQSKVSPEEGMSGRVDVPAGGSLKDVLRDLLVPDAEDVLEQARDQGKKVRMKDVDFWIGEHHFSVKDEEAS